MKKTGKFEGRTEPVHGENHLAQMKRLYATLSQVNQTIVRVKDHDELYQSICDIAVRHGEFALAWIGLLDAESGEVRPVVTNGLDVTHWPFPPINIHQGPFKNGLIATATRTSRVVTSEDVQTDKRTKGLDDLLQKDSYRSLAAVPFQLKGRTIGVLALVSREEGLFKAKEETLLLEEMGLDISFALDTMENEKTMRQWADAFKNCAHGIALGNPTTNQIFTCNPAFARMQGRTIEEISSMPILGLYAPQDHELVKQCIAKADREGSVQYEAHMIRKDGSSYPVQMDLVSVRDENGNLLYRVATQQDITERKRADEALRQSEERYRRTLDNMLEGCQIIDFDWRYVYVNETVAKQGRRTPEELLHHTMMELYPGIENTVLFTVLRDCMENRVVRQMENTFTYPDGASGWFELSIQPVPEGIFILSIDISERKRAEIALKASEENYRSLVENSESAIAVLDQAGRILYANSGGIRVWNDPQIVGKTIFDVYPAEYSSGYISAISKVIDTQTSIVDEVESLIRDRLMWFRLSMSPLKNPDGIVDKLLLNAWDITERKQAEENLQTSERTLKLFVEYAPAAIAMFDRDMKYIAVSRRYLADYRLADQDIIGRSHYEVFPEVPERWKEIHGRCLAGAIEKADEDPFPRADGTLDWVRWEIHPWYEKTGKIGGIILFSEVITERKQAEEQVRVQLQRLRALSEIDHAITSGLDMQLSLDILLNQVLSQLSVDAAMVLLLNNQNQTLEHVAGKGFRAPTFRQSYVHLGEGFAGQVGLERKILHIPDLADTIGQFKRAELLKDEQFVEYFGVPLIAKGMLKGVLEIFHRTHLDPDLEWLNYMETLGGQAAIAVDNAQLFEGMQQSNLELVAAYDATITGWSLAMDLRDQETEGHTQRVTDLTVKLAERMGLNQSDLIHIRRGALLHDIGKLGVPDDILLKPGKLTDEEWAIMRQHPTYALNMLLPITYLRPALDIPYCHHEKWDGSGYPRGLKGEQIPLPARIFAIVDVWDALRSDRPYRASWSAEQTRKHIHEQSNKHFDPRVVDIFLGIIENE